MRATGRLRMAALMALSLSWSTGLVVWNLGNPVSAEFEGPFRALNIGHWTRLARSFGLPTVTQRKYERLDSFSCGLYRILDNCPHRFGTIRMTVERVRERADGADPFDGTHSKTTYGSQM
jgi:hypothetical protein